MSDIFLFETYLGTELAWFMCLKMHMCGAIPKACIHNIVSWVSRNFSRDCVKSLELVCTMRSQILHRLVIYRSDLSSAPSTDPLQPDSRMYIADGIRTETAKPNS